MVACVCGDLFLFFFPFMSSVTFKGDVNTSESPRLNLIEVKYTRFLEVHHCTLLVAKLRVINMAVNTDTAIGYLATCLLYVGEDGAESFSVTKGHPHQRLERIVLAKTMFADHLLSTYQQALEKHLVSTDESSRL